MEYEIKVFINCCGNYGKNQPCEGYKNFMCISPKGRCVQEALEWLSKSLERLKKSENPEYLEDDLGDWALPPEQYPRW